jgi:hypothetical protein
MDNTKIEIAEIEFAAKGICRFRILCANCVIHRERTGIGIFVRFKPRSIIYRCQKSPMKRGNAMVANNSYSSCIMTVDFSLYSGINGDICTLECMRMDNPYFPYSADFSRILS